MKLLVSYANNERFFRAQHFLEQSAKKYFDGCASYHPDVLEDSFKQKNHHIFSQTRGGGYWVWKPYIILNALNLVKDGDYVFYVDSGNIILNDPAPLFNIVDKSKCGMLLFNNRDGAPVGTIWKNFEWTKYDCFKKMNCTEERYVQGNQIDGSYILVKKSDYALKFFSEYLTFCEDEDILTDKPNTCGENYDGFKEHRHDQSILSLLAIRESIDIEEEPSEWGNSVRTKDSKYGQIFMHHRGTL